MELVSGSYDGRSLLWDIRSPRSYLAVISKFYFLDPIRILSVSRLFTRVFLENLSPYARDNLQNVNLCLNTDVTLLLIKCDSNRLLSCQSTLIIICLHDSFTYKFFFSQVLMKIKCCVVIGVKVNC